MMTDDRGDGREKGREREGERGVREKGQARRDEFEPLKQRDGRGADTVIFVLLVIVKFSS